VLKSIEPDLDYRRQNPKLISSSTDFGTITMKKGAGGTKICHA